MAANRTNASRFSDQLKIAYEVREYTVDPNDLSAETVAAKVGLPAEQVFKHSWCGVIGRVSASR